MTEPSRIGPPSVPPLSPSSTPSSPTPSTTPTPASADPLLELMRTTLQTTARMTEIALSEMRELAVTLMQGRPSPSQSTSELQVPEQQTSYDYDSTPLPPGIEAVLVREENESAQAALMRERRELQTRLADLGMDLERLGLEERLPFEPADGPMPD